MYSKYLKGDINSVLYRKLFVVVKVDDKVFFFLYFSDLDLVKCYYYLED